MAEIIARRMLGLGGLGGFSLFPLYAYARAYGEQYGKPSQPSQNSHSRRFSYGLRQISEVD